MESCEIHSMSMEFLTADFHHLFFGDETARYDLAHAEDALYFLPYGTMVDEFQHIVYETQASRPTSAMPNGPGWKRNTAPGWILRACLLWPRRGLAAPAAYL